MIRLSALILTLSLTIGAAAPLLCELDCVSHASPSQAESCHDEASGPRLSAGSASCVHAVPDLTATAAPTKAAVSPESACTLSVGVIRHSSASALQLDHASGPLGVTARPRSVSRSILRI